PDAGRRERLAARQPRRLDLHAALGILDVDANAIGGEETDDVKGMVHFLFGVRELKGFLPGQHGPGADDNAPVRNTTTADFASGDNNRTVQLPVHRHGAVAENDGAYRVPELHRPVREQYAAVHRWTVCLATTHLDVPVRQDHAV